MQDPLFQPILINGLELKNRILMQAMHLHMCQMFEVSEQLIAFYAERARGGAGLITVGYATVDELSGNPGNIGAHADAFVPGLARLAAAIQQGGARAAVQLNHSGRYNHSMLLRGQKPVAPSAIPSRLTGETPRPLSLEEIAATIERFAQAAGRVQAAGFDAVEILAGTGYLISEFLSPLTNQRDDGYGGSFANRCRFGVEVIAAVRAAVGPTYPLMVRLNGNDFMPGGIGRVELRRFAQELVTAGADALCVNVGWHEAQVPQIVTKVPRGVYAYLAAGIRAAVTVPVIASHRINDPATARDLLREGTCDMVAMGRALIADPQLPNKAQRGREGTIVHCVACAQGCFDNLFKLKAVECLCNPRAGYERETLPTTAPAPRQVLVVGGGAAGMSAALAAAERGHAVTLVERQGRLGGQLHLAGAPPGREEFRELARDLSRQVAEQNIRVLLNREADTELLRAEAPAAVILATGGSPIAPPIPGADLPNVVQAWDVLAGSTEVGRRVAVIGGGAVGVETALLLAEQGTLSGEALKFLLVHQAETADELLRLAVTGSKEVVLIEMLEKFGANFGKSTRWGMLQDIQRYGVQTRPSARVLEIVPGGVRLQVEGRMEELAVDSVVLAVGTRAHNPLQQLVLQHGLSCQVVGDARQPAMVFDAIHQGFAAGRAID